MLAPDPPDGPPVPTHRMTTDEFIAWAMERDGRYELEDGFVVTLAAERLVHHAVKGNAFVALRQAVSRAGLPCRAFTDGFAVEVDASTVFEPDAMVRCGEPLRSDAIKLSDPVIVVEVESPSTGGRDGITKLVDYFRLPSVRHYLQIHPVRRVVVLHSRPAADAPITTRIVPSGPLRLDPPGLEFDVADLFADL